MGIFKKKVKQEHNESLLSKKRKKNNQQEEQENIENFVVKETEQESIETEGIEQEGIENFGTEEIESTEEIDDTEDQQTEQTESIEDQQTEQTESIENQQTEQTESIENQQTEQIEESSTSEDLASEDLSEDAEYETLEDAEFNSLFDSEPEETDDQQRESIEDAEDQQNFDELEDKPEIVEKEIKQHPEETNKIALVNKKKHSLSVKKHNNTDIEVQKKEKMKLYIIIDKKVPGMMSYASSFGLNIEKIFDSLDEAKKMLLLLDEKARIIIMDTGTGRFTTTTIKNELIDIIGTADEDKKFTVFYSDYSLKLDTLDSIGRDNKYVEWTKYQSTPITIAVMMTHSEEYISSEQSEVEKDIEISNSIVKFKGTEFDGELEKQKQPIIEPSEIGEYVEDEETAIKGYQINMRIRQ